MTFTSAQQQNKAEKQYLKNKEKAEAFYRLVERGKLKENIEYW